MILSYSFYLLCIFTTLLMLIYWGYRFSLNEDLSVVTYRKFYERDDDMYPTVSICLENPFLKQRLAEHGVDPNLYLEFLKGRYFSEEFLDINYGNVTMDISDFIKGYKMKFRNGSDIAVTFDSGVNIKEKRVLTHVSYNGFADSWNDSGTGALLRFRKCFALNFPKIQNLLYFGISLSNNMFINTLGERPTFLQFKAAYHLPRQYLLHGENEKWDWPYRAANESYMASFEVGDMAIMRKRNKHENRCIESYDAYDDWVVNLHKTYANCSTPYLKTDQKHAICNNKTLMKRGLLKESIVEIKNFDRPCKTMEKISVEYYETTLTTKKPTIGQSVGEFWFRATFDNPTFKMIDQKR